MQIRYIANVKTTATSSGMHNYIINTTIDPNVVITKSGYQYASKETAYQAGLQAARNAGYEISRNSDLTGTYLDTKHNLFTTQFYQHIRANNFTNIYVGDYFIFSVKGVRLIETKVRASSISTSDINAIVHDEYLSFSSSDLSMTNETIDEVIAGTWIDPSTIVETDYTLATTALKEHVFRVAKVDTSTPSITLVCMGSLGTSIMHDSESNVSFTNTFMYKQMLHQIYLNLHEVFETNIKESNVTLLTSSDIFSPYSYSEGDASSNNVQLPLFALNPEYISINSNYWLKDKESNEFRYVNASGHLNHADNLQRFAIRPVFTIS